MFKTGTVERNNGRGIHVKVHKEKASNRQMLYEYHVENTQHAQTAMQNIDYTLFNYTYLTMKILIRNVVICRYSPTKMRVSKITHRTHIHG